MIRVKEEKEVAEQEQVYLDGLVLQLGASRLKGQERGQEQGRQRGGEQAQVVDLLLELKQKVEVEVKPSHN